jgi:hypothetical protein
LAAHRSIAGRWQAELLRSSQAGVVLDPVNIESAAVMPKEKLDDETWVEESRRAARNLAEEQFDRGDLAQEVCGLLIQTKIENNFNGSIK